MGESALKLHNYEKCERHKNNSRTGGEQAVTLSSSGFVTWKFYIVEIVPVERDSLNIV